MRTWLLLASLFLVFMLLSGCYGFQDPATCDSIPNADKKIECYHKAAVQQAYLGDSTGAKVNCYKIEDVGLIMGRDRGLLDFQRKAEVLKNRCLYDIAVMLAGDSNVQATPICNEITDSPIGPLTSAPVTREMCTNQILRLKNLSAENYYAPGSNNICSMVVYLVLPLAALLFRRGLVH